MDRVEEDVKRSGVNKWNTTVANGMDWRSVVGVVKAGTRL
jgi:hypothetical protein